jgi:hypothetical protein
VCDRFRLRRDDMNPLKLAGIVLGGLVGLVVIVAVVAWIMVSLPSGIGSQVEEVESSPALAASFDSKWDDFSASVAASAPGTALTLTITQEELNSKINEELKTLALPDNLTVSSVNANLSEGEMRIAAKIKYSVLSGTAGLAAEIVIENGTPKVLVTDVDMGKLPIPSALKDQLRKLVPEDIIIQTAGTSFETSSVEIHDGEMVLSGVTK